MTERLHGSMHSVQVMDDEEVERLEAMQESNGEETVEEKTKGKTEQEK